MSDFNQYVTDLSLRHVSCSCSSSIRRDQRLSVTPDLVHSATSATYAAHARVDAAVVDVASTAPSKCPPTSAPNFSRSAVDCRRDRSGVSTAEDPDRQLNEPSSLASTDITPKTRAAASKKTSVRNNSAKGRIATRRQWAGKSRRQLRVSCNGSTVVLKFQRHSRADRSVLTNK